MVHAGIGLLIAIANLHNFIIRFFHAAIESLMYLQRIDLSLRYIWKGKNLWFKKYSIDINALKAIF